MLTRLNGKVRRKMNRKKNSMIWKSTLREIGGSMGRFLAIFAIVALGVGLFAGLKITRADFLKSMTNYYKELSFYDYRIMGSLGFSSKQVDFFRAQKDIRDAEGAIFQDMYYVEDDGSQKVGRFHSITDQVNKIVLTEGRMPEKDGEVLVDAMYFHKGSIGNIIRFSDENDEEKLSQFHQDAFEIVGIVKSPLYVQFERGNTSLGSGSVDAFFYLLKDSFTSDTFTEIYVKFDKDFDLYSKQYDNYMDEKKPLWEDYLKQAGRSRFEELPEMIGDAKNKLLEKRNEAQEELDQAKSELEDARAEITDAEKKLADGEEELKKGEDELLKARREMEEAKITIADKLEELEKGKADIENGEKKIAESEALIKAKEEELSAGKQQLEASRLTLQLGEMQQKLTMDGLVSEQKSIDTARENLIRRNNNADVLEKWAKRTGQEAFYQKEIEEDRQKIAKEAEELNKQEEDLHKRYLECLQLAENIKKGKKEFEEAEKKIKDGEEALEKGKALLLQGQKDLIEAQKMVAQGETELKEAQRKVTDGEKEIEKGRKTLTEKNGEWEEGLQKLQDGKREFEDGEKEYEDAVREFQEKMADAEKKITDMEKQYAEGKEPDGYLLRRNTNIGYVCFENDSSIVDGIANVFPVFFFLVAALVCVTTMNRMVEEQRTQIGVLKALGYSDGRIMFKFMFYSGLAATTGCLVGYAGGTIVFPFIIWTVYGIMYKAGAIAFTFNPVLAGISMIVSLMCSVGTTYLSCGQELSGQAAQLMRPKAPKAGKRVLLERIPFLWKRLSFLRKVAVRNIMRYKKRLFMMVLGIGGCTGLLVTGFGIKDSISGVAEVQYSEIQKYDIGVTLQKELDEDGRAELEALRQKGLAEYLPYQENTLDLVKGNQQKSVTVQTFSKDVTKEQFAKYIDMHTVKGVPIDMPSPGEAVITDKAAEKLHIREGDRIFLRNDAMEEKEYVVTGIMLNHIGNYVFLVEEECHPKNLYIKADKEGNLRRLAAALMKSERTADLSVIEDTVVRFDKMMESLNLIVVVVTACAAGLAFVVQFNLTNINITERIREIATIKVLGFFSGETALYVFRENMVLTFLGAFVGLGMGKLLHAFVIHEIDVDMVNFAVRIFPQSYVYSVFLTFLFSVFVNVLMNGKLENISMTESLKSVD